MRWISCVATALTLCGVGSATADDAASAGPPATVQPSPAAPPSGQKIPEVRIDPNAQLPECKRYTPTGSRIATQRCEMRATAMTPAEQVSHDAVRRDIDEMRSLQALRDQARDQARAEALRRAASSR